MENLNVIDIRPLAKARRYASVSHLLAMTKVAMLRRSTIRELQVLSDAQLEDIGIPRYAIRDVVGNKIQPTETHRKSGTAAPSVPSRVAFDGVRYAA